MQKRTLAILLIIFGLFGILAALYWTFSPVIKNRATLPRPTPSQPSPQPTPTPSAGVPQPTPKPSTPRSTVNEEQAELVLRQQAMAFGARQGTYTSADGFVALRDIFLDVNPTVRAFYQSEQQRLSAEHPLGSSWVQTTRALSSRITSALPLIGKTQATVTVQARQTIEADRKPAVISYQEIAITFTYDQGRWVVSRVEAKPLSL
jgi:hypothetical protein